VSEFVLAQGSQASAEELLRIVASVERGSQHPFSLPFLDLASSQNLELVWPTTFRYFPGKGIMASVETELSEYSVLVGNISLLEDHGVEYSVLVEEIEAMSADGLGVVLVAIDGKLSGVYGIKNAVKSGANRVVSELSNAGYRNILVSGDREEITRPFGLNLGISEIHSSMLPDDKAALVRELQIEAAGSVVMIGDGMNDAPALAQADVGIAVVQASALAQSSATVNLLNSDLSQVNDLFRLSKRVVKVTKQNVLWAFLYNIVLLPVAAGAGYLIYLLVGSGDGGSPIPWLFSETWLLNPTAAAAAMALSSVSVVANSLRIQGFK
jgi:Cu+-exporting ATPase